MSIGRLMVDLEGLEITEAEEKLLALDCVGGVILFTRNFHSVDQLFKLTNAIKQIDSNILIAVDHEGGRVQRFREGFTKIPAMGILGAVYKTDPEKAIDCARELGWLMAAELRCFNIDFTFAPVLDVDIGISKVIGDRSFSQDATTVTVLARSLIRGMKEAGVASTGKHFPGHGAVVADSHVDIPIDDRSLSAIESKDLVPFRTLLQEGMDAVMPAHVIYSQIDSRNAGFSSYWIEDYLRGKLGFNGVVFSDDLSMEGASVAGGYKERVSAAFEAGCDMALVCNNSSAAHEVAHWLNSQQNCYSDRLTRMTAKEWMVTLQQLQESNRWKNAQKLIAELN